MFVMFLALLSGPPAPSLNVEAHRVIDLSRINVEEAERLSGGEIIALVPLDVAPWQHGRRHVYGSLSRVGVTHAGVEVPERSAWLRREHDGNIVRVRGRVEVIRHRAAVHGSERFAGFVEIRFTER